MQRSGMPNTVTREQAEAREHAYIDEVIATRANRPGALLVILETVQDHHPQKYLPLETLRYIGVKMNLPLSQIFSVATFYALFNLEPQGEHTVCICRGTACHTRGSRALLESLRMEFGFNGAGGASDADKVSLTTPDGKFTIRTVACFGQCALAPVVEIDHRICGHVNERTLQRDVNALEAEED
jgi:NADH-quinone oxidoreductase subunit E